MAEDLEKKRPVKDSNRTIDDSRIERKGADYGDVISESSLPNFKFTPPPPPVKKDNNK